MLEFPRWKTASILGVCLIFLLLALPNFLPQATRAKLPWLPSKTISLGLDLRGGSHLLLEVDFAAYLKERLSALVDDVRTKLRAEKVGYRNLSLQGDKVILVLRRETLPKDFDAAKTIRTIDGDLQVSESDDTLTISYGEAQLMVLRQKLVEQSIEIVHRRVDETGTKEPSIQRQGEDRILLQVPGLDDPEKLKNLLGRTAKMTFHLVRTDIDPMSGVAPLGARIVPADTSEAGARYAIDSRAVLSGDMLTDANATFAENRPVVSFEFNNQGARRFGEITSQNVGKPFAILLDDKVITAPRINEPILDGRGIISGNFTAQSANELALLLRSGALPAPLKVVEERTVGPSLGADSIVAGKNASITGLVLVVLFMILAYGLFGIFATVAVIVNAVIILAVMSLFQATLTLPGIAGMVLTLGMAVDANVLICERIREEIRHGRSPYAAIESGYRLAFGTIFDANLTALIAALLLYYFGTGAVKGFAVTLSIGIVSSMFTAVTLTRLMTVIWLKRTRPKTIPI